MFRLFFSWFQSSSACESAVQQQQNRRTWDFCQWLLIIPLSSLGTLTKAALSILDLLDMWGNPMSVQLGRQSQLIVPSGRKVGELTITSLTTTKNGAVKLTLTTLLSACLDGGTCELLFSATGPIVYSDTNKSGNPATVTVFWCQKGPS